MKKTFYILFLAIATSVLGQQPLIIGISPTHLEVGGTVTISGSNLGGRVFFGGVEATSVNVVSGNVIEAEVPPGATHGSITVLNNSLIAQSAEQFYISFVGADLANPDSEFLVSSGETDASDICICDLDGDDLNDAVIAHNVDNNAKSEISVYLNQSGPATAATSFTKQTNINNSENLSGFISTTCSDLDNDGKPELIFTTNQGTNVKHIYIYRNQSTAGNITLNYLSTLSLRLPNTTGGGNRVSRVVKSADMDGDGKNDLIVGNDTDNTLHIFRNTSTGTGNFSFATPTEISADGDLSGVLDVADLNNDGRMDIISMPFRENSTRIHILKNNSIVGSFSFEAQSSITNGGQTNGVSTGDFDDDGLIDIAVASRNTGLITTFRNSSAGSTITFDAGEDINIAGASPFGLDLGDINGDGKLDIVAAFATGNIYVIPNNSTSGNVSFTTEQQIATTSTTQNVCVGDLNGDAKPDIAFTHDISANGPIGDLGVFMNRNCLAPVLSPLGLNFCTGTNFRLFATNALDAIYNWSVTAGDMSTVITPSNNFADFNVPTGTSVTIQVTITQSNTTCSTPTATETFSLDASVTTDPVINASQAGVLCAGDAVTLSSSTTNNSYQWTLPDGTIVTTATIDLTSVSSSDAGEYKLRVQNNGSCASSEVTRTIEVEEAPLKNIINDGCTGSNITLNIGTGSFNYSWKRDGSSLGETGSSIQTNTAGVYTVDVETTTNMCITESESFTVPAFTTSMFDLPTERCVDSPIQLVSTSTGDNAFTIAETWAVLNSDDTNINSADTTRITPGDPLNFSFNSTGTYKVRLTTEYSDFVICPNVLDRTITISNAPTITFDTADDTEKCQGDALTVGVTSPAASDIASYSWTVNGNATTNSTVDATTLIGDDFVYAVLELTTTIGCTVKDSVRIVNFPTTADISSPDFDVVTNDTVRLEDANSIVLSAENIVSDFAWEPASIIDDTTASSITVFPSTSTTRVTLTGIDGNNCQVVTAVTIILDNIRPRKTFSPNGDGVNDSWEILNTDALTGCEIFIFDSRGKNIKVAESPFVNNLVWDGTSGGNQVPEGLYYFVLKCDDSSLSKSGSILLAR